MSDHTRRYIASDGEDGHIWKKGAPTLVLTTRGRHSGEQRRAALIYAKEGDHLLIVASKAGADEHPWWYLNLIASPEVEVQVGSEKFTCTATPAPPEVQPRLWEIMVGIWPDYAKYQAKTQRAIPIVILERGPRSAAPGSKEVCSTR